MIYLCVCLVLGSVSLSICAHELPHTRLSQRKSNRNCCHLLTCWHRNQIITLCGHCLCKMCYPRGPAIIYVEWFCYYYFESKRDSSTRGLSEKEKKTIGYLIGLFQCIINDLSIRKLSWSQPISDIHSDNGS